MSIFILIVILLLIYYFTTSNKIDKFIYSIIIGGALGNFYDRIFFKAVPDFIDFHVGSFHWFIFNVSDIFISTGVILMILMEIIFTKNRNYE